MDSTLFLPCFRTLFGSEDRRGRPKVVVDVGEFVGDLVERGEKRVCSPVPFEANPEAALLAKPPRCISNPSLRAM